MLRAYLLGRPRLLLDDVPVPLGGRPKVVPLLAYFLVHRSVTLERPAVANALWPDAPEDGARANLRRHLNYLGAVLPPPPRAEPWIAGDGTRLWWSAQYPTWVDVEEFVATSDEPNRVEEVLALYGGELMTGYDDEWLLPHRARLREKYVTLLEAALRKRRSACDFAGAVAAAQELLRDDPWREDVVRAIVETRLEAGDRAGALAEYDRFARALAAELGTEPMVETRALAQAIRDDAPPPRAARRPAPGNGGASRLPFTGRDAELAALLAQLDAAAAGSGTLVTIGGDAGIGKTRLVREFALEAQRRGAQVWSAGTGGPESAPYQPFVALAQQAAALAATLGTQAPALEAGADAAPVRDAESGRRRLRLFDRYADAFAALSERRTVVLIIEDVHWAGAATLALLEHLARALRGTRVLLVATYREDDAGAVRASRRRLERDARPFHLALAPLGPGAVAAIATAAAPTADGTILFARSEGSPLVLEALVRDEAMAVGSGVAALRDIVDPRLKALSGSARTIAEFAAVLGPEFELDVLRRATGWRESQVLEGLDELIDRRLVAEHAHDGPATYAFAHQLLQALVYDTMEPAQLRRRHHRVAAVLAQTGTPGDADAARLALHYDRAAEPERAAEYYLAAARYAMRVFANEEAAEFLSRALQLRAGADERFELLQLRERVAEMLGDREQQARDLEELSALARRRDPPATDAVLERRIALANLVGDRRRERVTIAWLERRLRRRDDPRARIGLLAGKARYLRAINDFAGARDTYAQLETLARACGDRRVHASSRLAVVDSYVYEGRLAEAHAQLDGLREAVENDGDREALVRTLLAFARASLVQQDYAAMSSFAQEALSAAQAIGDREGEALALHTLANGMVYSFRTAQTRAHYERALAIYERMAHRVGLASIFVDMGLFYTELGLLDGAMEFYARARALAAELEFRFVACVERIDAGYCHRLRGEPDASRAAAAAALDLARALGSAPLESAALGTLGAAESALGEHGDALAHLRRSVELRRPAGATPRLGDNLRALAAAALDAGEVEEARRAADAMLSLYRRDPRLAPQPPEWLWTAAQVARAQGRAGFASLLVREARSVMRARAAAIDDAAVRSAYLDLPFNRVLGTTPRRATAAPRRRG